MTVRDSGYKICEAPAANQGGETCGFSLLSLPRALLVPAAVAGAAVESVVVVDYDLAAGEQPEGVAVDKRGDVYVSLAPLGQVWSIDRDGTKRMLAQVVPAGAGNGVLGMAVDAPGNVYVAAATFNSASGVYKIARDGSSRDYVEQKQSSFRTA